MHYVYLFQSLAEPKQRYTGSAEDLRQRLADHNEGKSVHTAQYRPWRLITYVAFSHKDQALEFERYLKVGSGHAFARRHFGDVGQSFGTFSLLKGDGWLTRYQDVLGVSSAAAGRCYLAAAFSNSL